MFLSVGPLTCNKQTAMTYILHSIPYWYSNNNKYRVAALVGRVVHIKYVYHILNSRKKIVDPSAVHGIYVCRKM